MKLRENPVVKVLVFLLAVASFTGCTMLAWYQLYNYEALWSSGGAVKGYSAQYLIHEHIPDIRDLVYLYFLEEDGETLSSYESNLKATWEQQYSAENTNLRWQVYAEDSDTLLYGNAKGAVGEGVVWSMVVMGREDGRSRTYYMAMWVDPALQVDDDYRDAVLYVERWRSARTTLLALSIGYAVLGLLFTGFLCAATGHRRGEEGITLNRLNRVPGDLLLTLLGLGLAFIAVEGDATTAQIYYDASQPMPVLMFVLALFAVPGAVLSLTAVITVAARCKTRTLLRNTLIWRLCAWAQQMLSAVPLSLRAAVGGVLYTVFTILCYDQWPWLWLLVTAVVVVYLCRWAYQWRLIRQGTKEIVGGNTSFQIDTRKMLPDLKRHADQLNSLGQTISNGVEEQMQSERFKAELITNVSHDLKTPLTSIINYVDLLKKADIQDPQAAEYLEVLERKSQRLKKLTEDLVEASKASTGSLPVDLERLDLEQLLDQALAEYQDRLAGQGLVVVRAPAQGPVWVRADGRHLWRVIDNLLSNCAKYALPGTRVYVSVQQEGDCAQLSVKNISREELNVPAQRLMERFVRGDAARAAEGSGLGLSIAQSLTELQGGRFAIGIDGDLFKATVTLDLDKTPQE